MNLQTLTNLIVRELGLLAITCATLVHSFGSLDSDSQPLRPVSEREDQRTDAVALQSPGGKERLAGYLTAQIYTGIMGTSLQDLRNSVKDRQNRPDKVELVNIFEYPPGAATQPPPSGTIDEVTAYGLAWKKGSTWRISPNPIPIDHVTRAAALWKDGKSYRLHPTQGSAPKWRVNTPALGKLKSRNIGLSGMGAASPSVISTLPALFVPGENIQVRISAKPAATVSAYAIEEQIPEGWTVANVNEGGSFDSVNGLVKWGPFFDNTPREFTYTVMAKMDATDTVQFSGTGSFDGESVAIGGQRQSRQSSRLSSLAFLPGGEFELGVKGKIGKQLVIEGSSNLIDWTPVGTVVNSSGKIKFSDKAPARELRFYRVVVK